MGPAILTVLASAFLAVAGVGLLAHFRNAGRWWTLGLVAFSPYLMLGAPIALILLVAAQQWFAAIGALVVVALWLSTQARLYRASAPPPDAQDIVVMTSNLRLGLASSSAVVNAVRQHSVDVLMLEELTEDAQDGLLAAGLNAVLPYHAAEPQDGAMGTGLWSRYPLTDVCHGSEFFCAFVKARADVPGLSSTVTLAALHMAGPITSAPSWVSDIRRLPEVLRSLPIDAPVIVGGDFNATPDTRQFRAALRTGYRNAAAQAGAGLVRTYPSHHWFPSLISIDHVVTRNAVGRSTQTVSIPGSDHRALVVRVAVPRDVS